MANILSIAQETHQLSAENPRQISQCEIWYKFASVLPVESLVQLGDDLIIAAAIEI